MLDYAVPVVVGMDTPDIFSTRHYPRGIGFEDVVPEAEFRRMIEGINRIILCVNVPSWLYRVCIRLGCACGLALLPFYMTLIACRLLVVLAIARRNFAWRARGCSLALSRGCTLERSSLHVRWKLPSRVIGQMSETEA